VTLQVNLRTLADAAGVTDASRLHLYYWSGSRWVPVAAGTVAGEGEANLHVADVRVDLAAGSITMTADHLSSYAVGIDTESASNGRVPGPAPALGLAALLALALLRRRLA
jgi:MYXO-CTERM domain-containing protein